MSWHYQIRRRTEDGETWYDVVEVYVNPRGWTVDGVRPAGDSVEGVVACLEQMLADVKRYPVLEEEHG